MSMNSVNRPDPAACVHWENDLTKNVITTQPLRRPLNSVGALTDIELQGTASLARKRAVLVKGEQSDFAVKNTYKVEKGCLQSTLNNRLCQCLMPAYKMSTTGQKVCCTAASIATIATCAAGGGIALAGTTALGVSAVYSGAALATCAPCLTLNALRPINGGKCDCGKPLQEKDCCYGWPCVTRDTSHYSRMDETSKSADSSQEKTILMKPRLLDDESGLLGHVRDMQQQQQQLLQQQQALQQQLQQQQLQQQLQQQQQQLQQQQQQLQQQQQQLQQQQQDLQQQHTINDMQGMGLR